jgi:hypothetical protein
MVVPIRPAQFSSDQSQNARPGLCAVQQHQGDRVAAVGPVVPRVHAGQRGAGIFERSEKSFNLLPLWCVSLVAVAAPQVGSESRNCRPLEAGECGATVVASQGDRPPPAASGCVGRDRRRRHGVIAVDAAAASSASSCTRQPCSCCIPRLSLSAKCRLGRSRSSRTNLATCARFAVSGSTPSLSTSAGTQPARERTRRSSEALGPDRSTPATTRLPAHAEPTLGTSSPAPCCPMGLSNPC